MQQHANTHQSILHSPRTRLFCFLCLAVLAVLMLPGTAIAQQSTAETVCGFASSINKVLNAISIIVVTIAVVFSGYQIAFAHKRIGDVAPVLIGAILIGAAGEIAKMFLTTSTQESGAAACTAQVITHLLNHYA